MYLYSLLAMMSKQALVVVTHFRCRDKPMSDSVKEEGFMRSISYSRRLVCQLGFRGLAGLTLLGVAGCGGGGTASTPAESKTLQLIFWGPASRNKLTRKAIDLY